MKNKHEKPYLKLIKTPPKEVQDDEEETSIFERPPRNAREYIERRGITLRSAALGMGAILIMTSAIVLIMLGLALSATI